MTAADLHPDTGLPRPDTCCGVCPPIAGGGWDCTCPGLPGCPAALADAGLAAGRAETTTATTEDMMTRLAAAEAELDRLCDGGRFTMSIPAREGYDSDLLIQAALSDLRSLLATARTRPTREQIARAIDDEDTTPCAVCDDDWCYYCRADALRVADAVLALLEGGGDR